VTRLTRDNLAAVMPRATPSNLDRYAAPLTEACAEYGIDTPIRLAAFLAQIAHESGSLSRVVENLNYSADGLRKTWPSRFDSASAEYCARNPERIANIVYASRMGNGDEESGDGWAYRGRGIIQITGRATYAACGAALGLDLVGNPLQLEAPVPACRSAGWFWSIFKNLNGLADAGDFEKITRRINGGLNGYPDRLAYYERAKAALGV
jgi:putative chitinase